MADDVPQSSTAKRTYQDEEKDFIGQEEYLLFATVERFNAVTATRDCSFPHIQTDEVPFPSTDHNQCKNKTNGPFPLSIK